MSHTEDPDDVPKPRGNPRALKPNQDQRLHPNRAPERSLAEELQEVVDEARQLNTDFGIRPYQVFSIVARWSGGERGRGEPTVISEVEFLPTPKVKDYDNLSSELLAGGRTERGTVRLSEISARYTEDDIMALFHVQPLPQEDEGWIEIRHDQRDGETKRRRLVVKGIPFHEGSKFQWVCKLLSQDSDRTRAGQIRDPSNLRTHGF